MHDVIKDSIRREQFSGFVSGQFDFTDSLALERQYTDLVEWVKNTYVDLDEQAMMQYKMGAAYNSYVFDFDEF